MKRKFESYEIRGVLRFIRDNEWSSTSQIARATGMEPQSVTALIRNELRLRTKMGLNQDGIQPTPMYALPEIIKGSE